ncbi:hypothetical protein MTP03_09130 [Tsukamurella sp. PLM1]|nr:hypothetical protein MTP03_09130 [Tsukamurella sp. PLM1]
MDADHPRFRGGRRREDRRMIEIGSWGDVAVELGRGNGNVVSRRQLLGAGVLRWPPHRRTRHRTHKQCTAFRTLATPRSAVDELDDALLCAADCLDPDQLVAVLDSTLRMDVPLTDKHLQELFAKAPRRITRVLKYLDPLAGSGTESIVRYRLRCKHIAVRSQVTIPGIGRVDLLVGDKLIIECDSEGNHSGAQRKIDLKRDRKAEIGDYHVLRVDYDEVMTDWKSVYKDIAEIVHTDRHLGKVREISEVNPRPPDNRKPDLVSCAP